MAKHLPVRATLAVVGAFLVAGAVGLSSSCSVGVLGVPDGGPLPDVPDAQRPDAKDAARTDGAMIQPPDPSQILLPGEWVTAGSLPEECGLRVSKKPELIPPFPWRPCANGIAQCEAFTADWDDKAVPRAFDPARLDPVWEDAAGVHISYERQMETASLFGYKIVQSMTGPGETAFVIAHGFCGVLLQASRHGFAASFNTPQKVSHVGWGQVDRAFEIVTTPTTLTPNLNLYQGVARGDGFLVVEATNFGGPIVGAAYRLNERSFVGASPNHTLPNELPLPVSGGFVSVLDTAPSSVGFVPLAGSTQVLARSSTDGQISYLAMDRKANSLVWAESSLTVLGDHVVWTSPMATSEGAMQRRKVARFSAYSSQLVANAGVAVVVLAPNLARIIRLSDGLGWDVPGEPGLQYVTGLWVNDDSVWLLASKVYSGGLPINSAVRFSRASLGNPTVPSGL